MLTDRQTVGVGLSKRHSNPSRHRPSLAQRWRTTLLIKRMGRAVCGAECKWLRVVASPEVSLEIAEA